MRWTVSHRSLLGLCVVASLVSIATGVTGCRELENPAHAPDAGDTNTDAGTDSDSDSDTDIDLSWVELPSGTFMMGSEEGQLDEGPVHEVMVQPFEILETEVTVDEYRACVAAGACSTPATDVDDQCNWSFEDRDTHPVNCVDWYQALDFCDWAGGRLPSEAEWEYAARGAGQDIEHPWGGSWVDCNHAVMDDGGSGCGEGQTWPVCSKPLGNTEQGLCDMSGNVWEWVRDWYHSSYNGAPDDGSSWEEPSGTSRVLRGGSYLSHADIDYSSLTVFARGHDNPIIAEDDYGFRCVREI
jgi:iron(II)-dependent oxidoreductase